MSLAAGVAMAQSAEDVYRVSFENTGYGTARTAAMGGAFTSLGADVSSMSINPAGIGMYRSSDISITPTVKVSSVTSTASDGSGSLVERKNNQTTFGLSNISGVMSIFSGDRNTTMRAFNMGFGYSKKANFRSTSYSQGNSSLGTIGDFFVQQLDELGRNPDLLTSSESDPLAVYRGENAGYWGAIMAFNNLLVDGSVSQPWTYSINPRNLSMGDHVIPSQRVVNKGSVEEYLFSFGTNLWDRLYLGFSMGARSFYSRSQSHYMEDGVAGNIGDMNQLDYFQSTTMSGTAFDFKIGATVEPIDGLKIGAAFHAPTLTKLSYEYYGDMGIRYGASEYYGASTPYALTDFEVKSAPRLLVGVSYRILKRAIVSVDYERVWYNKMQVKYGGLKDEDFTAEIGAQYKNSGNLKAGVEVYAGKGWFLRGGYAFYGSALKGVDREYGQTRNISAGIGYRVGGFYADLAYVNIKQKRQPFWYYPPAFNDIDYNVIDQTVMDHLISLTLGFKF